jgi:DeoR/GlpR family transcriptional regulator of sugar metabolism
MKKEKLTERAEYVQTYVNEYAGQTKCAVLELADRLFLSESTIWKDLTVKTENPSENNCNKK